MQCKVGTGQLALAGHSRAPSRLAAAAPPSPLVGGNTSASSGRPRAKAGERQAAASRAGHQSDNGPYLHWRCGARSPVPKAMGPAANPMVAGANCLQRSGRKSVGWSVLLRVCVCLCALAPLVHEPKRGKRAPKTAPQQNDEDDNEKRKMTLAPRMRPSFAHWHLLVSQAGAMVARAAGAAHTHTITLTNRAHTHTHTHKWPARANSGARCLPSAAASRPAPTPLYCRAHCIGPRVRKSTSIPIAIVAVLTLLVCSLWRHG